MKIGFYLGYGPQVILHKEGLGRYIGSLIKGTNERGHDVVLAYPAWLEASVNELLKEFSVSQNDIRIITCKTPALWKVYDRHFFRPKKKRTLLPRLKALVEAGMAYLLNRIVRDGSLISLVFHVLVGILAVIILAIPAIVCLLILAVVKLILKIISKITKDQSELVNKLKKELNSLDLKLENSSNDLWLDGFNAMFSNTLEKLTDTVNRSEPVSCWYVPTLFWPETGAIKGCKVYCAPDLVTRDYAVPFRTHINTEYNTLQCAKTLENGRYFITYCDYLKDTLLIDQFAKAEDDIKVIYHANNELMHYIDLAGDQSEEKDVQDKAKIDAYCRKLCGLGDIHYIFYSSQLRPHKNVVTFLKAYKHLLRTQKISCKIVITGNIDKFKPVKRFIKKNDLGNEVISCYNVPANKLAALYYCADMVVNPTLYEGGFPFTFGEGMSVGTPSLMSRIPQVQEIFEPAGLEDMMFDPYSWEDIAEKIEYWLPRKDELFRLQQPLYEKLAKRTPDVVADEYVEAFRYFAEKEKALENKRI